MIIGYGFLDHGSNASPFSAGESLSVHLQEQQLSAQVAKIPGEVWGMESFFCGWQTCKWTRGGSLLSLLKLPGQFLCSGPPWVGWRRVKEHMCGCPLGAWSRAALQLRLQNGLSNQHPRLHGVCWGAQHYLFPVYFDERQEFQALPKSLTSPLKLIWALNLKRKSRKGREMGWSLKAVSMETGRPQLSATP